MVSTVNTTTTADDDDDENYYGQELQVPVSADDDDDDDDDLPLVSSNSNNNSFKRIIYFCRHAEALHNVKEREAVQAAVKAGLMTHDETERARKAVLEAGDAALRDAPLSADGTQQARNSSVKLQALFRASPPGSPDRSTTSGSSGGGGGRKQHYPEHHPSTPTFRRPDVVLVSPLRRALMTATELFWNCTNDNNDSEEEPPLFLAIEALREKRTGYGCDERHSVADLRAEFPHVDFSDVLQNNVTVPLGEDNAAVRKRVAQYLDHRLGHVPGQHLAVVTHKGWLRELRQTLKERVDSGEIRANFDVNEWDKSLYGNAEVRIAALRWQDGVLSSVVSRSVDNALLASAAMMGDGFEFALGPPTTGFSIFLADRTTKVHFISLAEGTHNVAIREQVKRQQRQQSGDDTNTNNNKAAASTVEALLQCKPGQRASDHPLFDARLTAKGAKQADRLRQMLAQRPSGGRPFTAFDLVIVSPLTRACETAQLVFGDTPGIYGGEVVRPPRILVNEECRERYGKYVCDARRPVHELEMEYPNFDFSEMAFDEDVLHSDNARETTVDVQERALRLLGWLSRRPERCVAVVTHAEFLRHLFGQFGDTLDENDRSCLQRTGVNCELRSVVLCSHGNVEREEINAPASTVRVPSVSSLSSLSNLA